MIKTLLRGMICILIPLLASACTRRANSPVQLTRIAEQEEIFRVTAIQIIAENPDTATPTPTATETPLVSDTPMPVTDTPTPTVTDTATPAPPSPTPRATFPVETIAPATATPTPEHLEPSKTPTPDIPLPELHANFSQKAFYVVQSGDTAEAIAYRYGTEVDQIRGLADGAEEGFLEPGTQLLINAPSRIFSSAERILPDEYIIMAYPSIGYDLEYEVNNAGGYLASYTEYTSVGNLSGTEIIQKVATDYSISPIILMELLEYKSHWVSGQPQSVVEEHFPLGWLGENAEGLYKQLMWAAQELSKGYYGWRYGTLSEIPFYKNPQPDFPFYFNPLLNAGSVAIQYLFAQLYTYEEYEEAIYGADGFLQQFYLDFGNVWDFYIPDPNGFNNMLAQPALTLPFAEGDEWCITGGPHEAWTTGSPLGALDFAPRMAEHGCALSNSWVTASAPGLVIRTGVGTVVLDLDMDGHEETGWVIYYLHIRTDGRVETGTSVPLHGRIGHPSCEGGNATGTHVHIARKYNGEWVNAFGPLPFNMSGWIPFGGLSYRGGVTRGDRTVYAQAYASSETLIGY